MKTSLNRFAKLSLQYKSVLCGLICTTLLAFAGGAFAQTATDGDYRSVATGNWSAAATWQVRAAGSWAAASVAPTSANNVYIQTGHTVTANSASQACKDLHINTDTAKGVLAIGANTVQVNGKIRAYTGAAVITTPADGTFYSGQTSTAAVVSGLITTSGAGKLSIVGNTRTVFNTGEWGSGTTVGAIDVSMTAGQTVSAAQQNVKAGSWTFTSGTFDAGTKTISATGNITILSGATMISSATGAGAAVFQSSSTALGGTLDVQSGGTLKLAGAAPAIAMTTVTLNGTVEYSGAAQSLGTVPSGSSQGGAAVLNTYNNLTFSGTLTKTLLVSITVNGTLATPLTFALSSFNVAMNGTFRIDQGGFASTTGGAFTYGASATLQFNNSSGSYGVNADVFWPTASGPPNVNVSGAGGITMNVARTVSGLFQAAAGVAGGSALTLNGTAQINAGGFFSTAPIYGSSSTLKYNTGTTYGKSTEWSADSGTIGTTAGYPNSVQISGNTTLNYPNGSSYGARSINGSLTVDSGSSFYMDFGSPAANGALTVPGNVSLAGNLSLGNVAPGDLIVKGNWTRTGVFTPNGRAVFFSGTSAQSITGATTFDYLILNNSAGLTLNNAITVNQTLTLTSGLITTTAANLLTIASSGSFASASSSSYIKGPLAMAWVSGTPASKTFPVGKNSNYRPLTVNMTALTGASTVTAEQIDPGSGFGGSFASVTPFTSRYWTVTESGSSARTYNVTLDGTGFTPTQTAVILKYNNPTTTKLATSFSSPNYTATGLTSFSDFALGDEISTPTISAGTVTGFGNQQVNTTATTKTYSLAGGNLTPASGNLTVSPPANFEVSLDGTTWVANPGAMNVAYSGGTLNSTTISVRFKPTAVTSYAGNIANAGGGAATVNTAVSGTGTAPGEPTLSATASQPSTINLAIGLNTAGNNVVVVFNNTGTFTTPSGAPGSLGSAFAGGTLLQNSTSTAYAHTSLTTGTYFYKAFSYDSTGNFYSPLGVTANASILGTYYSQSSSDPGTLANWNSSRTGGGNTPGSFTAGDTFDIQGTGNGGTTPHTMTTTAAWTVSGTGSKIQVEGGATLQANNLVAVPTFQVDNGGIYVHNAASGTANGTTSDIPGSTTRTFGASSTVEFQKWANAGTAPVALPSGFGWGNLKINIASLGGNWQQASGLTTVNGNLTIAATGGGSFEFALASTVTYTLTVTGDLVVSGGILDFGTGTVGSGGANLNLGGNLNHTAGTMVGPGSSSSTGTGFKFIGGTASVTCNMLAGDTAPPSKMNISIDAAKTVTLTSDLPTGTVASRTMTVSGILNCGANHVVGTAGFTLSSGATLGIADANGITSTAATGAIQVTGTRTFNAAANYTYSGSAASAVTGNQLPSTLSSLLTINNGTGVTLSTNTTVNGTLTLANGAFSIGANNTLTLNGSISTTSGTLAGTATSSLVVGGSTPVNLTSGLTSLNNLTVNDSGGVTLSAALAVSGQLRIVSGTLNLGSADSTAGYLVLGTATQAADTYGSTSSSANQQNNTYFAGTAKVTVSGQQSASTLFRSKASGSWNAFGTWEQSTDSGATWAASTSFSPVLGNQVYVQAGHAVTLTSDEACGTLEIAVGTLSTDTGSAGGGVACGTFTLSNNGSLRAYYGLVGAAPAVLPTQTYQTTAASFNPVTKSTTSATGKLKFVGNTRTVLETGKWGGYNTASGLLADWEFALTSGQTATCQTDFKASNITVSSGTLDTGGNNSKPSGLVTEGTGNVTISSGATWISSRTGDVFAKTTSTQAAALITVNGTLKLSGAAPTLNALAYNFAGGTIEYSGGAQTLLGKSTTATTSADPNAAAGGFNNITLSGTGTKTLSGTVTTTVNGTFTKAGDATVVLALGTGTLSYGGSATLQYAGTAAQTTADTEFPPTGGVPPNVAINNSLGVSLNNSKTLSGMLTLTSGALSIGANTLSLNGTVTTSGGSLTGGTYSTINCSGSSAITLPSITGGLNNLTVGGTAAVTIPSTTIANTLYISTGTLNFGGSTGSTAGQLTFDNSTYQASGTWGATGAANNDGTHFAGSGSVTVVNPTVASGSQFRSRATGNWNSAGTWEISNDSGTTWYSVFSGFVSGSTPGSTHKVYVQAGQTVTLTENEACSDINVSVGTTSSTTGGSGGKVACVTFALEVNGQLRGYWAPLGSTPGTDQPTGSAFDPFTKTGAGGKIKFVGSGRTFIAANQWGSYNITSLPADPGGAADWEFALNNGSTGTIAANFRPANFTINVGTTLDIGTVIAGVCGNGGLGVGTGGAGNITVSSGATLVSSGTGVISRRTSTASSGTIGTFANQGTLKLSGAAPLIAASAYDFSGGTVEYNGTAQTLLSRDPVTTSANQVDPSSYNHLTLSGSGAKALGTNITVNGTLTMGGTASLDLGGKTLTYGGSSTLAYAGTAPQTSAATEFPASGSLPANLKISNPSGVLLGGSRTITGTLTVDASGYLDFNSQNLTVGGTSFSSSGALTMEVTRTGANTFTGSKLTQTAGTLTYNGTLTNSLLSGGPIQQGETITLFAVSGSGAFANSPGFTAVTPSAQSGLTATTTALTGGTGGNITYTCDGTLVANAAADTTTCSGSLYSLNGSGSGGSGTYTTFAWTATPAGFTSSSANPSVSPTTTTTYHLTVTDSVGCTATKDVVVTVNQPATADAGANQSVNHANTVTLAGAYGGSATSASWSGGGGSFNPNANTTNAVYTPSTAEKIAGTVTLTLTTDDPAGPCGAASGFVIITLTNTPPVANAKTYSVVQGNTLTIAIGSGAKALATDVDADPLIFSSLGDTDAVEFGVAVINPGGSSLNYTNTSGSVGSQTVFSYIVSDQFGGLATNSITIRFDVATGANLVSATASGGFAYLTYAGLPGTNYALDWATNVTYPINWTQVQVRPAESNGALRFTNLLSTYPTNDYFRTRYVP